MLTPKSVFIKDIRPGDIINDSFLAFEKNMAVTLKGNPYLNLRLRDKTGEIDGRVWDNAEALSSAFKRGDVIFIKAKATSYRDVTQLTITNIAVLDDDAVDPADYSPQSRSDRDEMFGALKEIVSSVANPSLRALLDALFDDPEIAGALRTAPAAKGFHHSYIGGLLEHTLSVTRVLDAIVPFYPQADRDLVITGGILHDIGKISELSFTKMIDYTDEGRLIGHIVLGLELLNRKIAGIEGFPENLAMKLRHIMVSHHGELEFGSPKRPKTLEALLVNYVDDLDAKANAFREFMNDADDDSDWTPYHRLLERFLYKGK